MKTILWTGMLIGAALLTTGCGRAQTDQPAPPVAEPRAETPIAPVPQDSAPQLPAEEEEATSTKMADKQRAAEGARVAGREEMDTSAEKAGTEASGAAPPAEKLDKPTVLEAVGRALFKSFTSEPDRTTPDAPAFRPNR